VYYFFTLTCLTAPFAGVIIGGVFFSNMGGYNSPRSFKYCCLILFVGIFLAIPIPLTESKWLVYSCVWILLFIGAFVLPTLTGIMLNSISENHKTTANSLATLGYNLFGYLPAPFIYGCVSSAGTDTVYWGRAAMASLISWVLFTFAALVVAYYY
jgi:MFS family permease